MDRHGIAKSNHRDLALFVFQFDPMTNVDFAPAGQVRRHEFPGTLDGVYVRRVEKRDGQLWNIEFQTVPAVKDPGKQK